MRHVKFFLWSWLVISVLALVIAGYSTLTEYMFTQYDATQAMRYAIGAWGLVIVGVSFLGSCIVMAFYTIVNS